MGKRSILATILVVAMAIAAPAASARPRHHHRRARHHHRHHHRRARWATLTVAAKPLPKPVASSAPAPASPLVPVLPPWPATTQAFTITDQVGVPAALLALIERAVSDQSRQLAAAWHTPGAVFTATGGIPVTIQPAGTLPAGDGGWHAYDPATGPSIIVGYDPTAPTLLQMIVSHEVMETLVNPAGNGMEVCDPVEGHPYWLDGADVSDFVFPAYFTGGAGPFDQTGVLTAPAATA